MSLTVVFLAPAEVDPSGRWYCCCAAKWSTERDLVDEKFIEIQCFSISLSEIFQQHWLPSLHCCMVNQQSSGTIMSHGFMGLFPGTTFASGKHTSPLNIREANTRFRGSSQQRVVAMTPLSRSLSLKQDEGNHVLQNIAISTVHTGAQPT